MTYLELKNKFAHTLKSVYNKNEIYSFFYLLMDAKLQLKRVDIALNATEKIPEKELLFFVDALKKLQNEIPIQYIIGSTTFFGLDFYVNKNTLIPRPETEELVSWILSEAKKTPLPKTKNSKLKIIDIGTGTGCIAISLAKNLLNTSIWALDISNEALQIAQKNAALHKTTIQFETTNILKTNSLSNIINNNKETSLPATANTIKFDIIVSNPPYVRMLEKQEIKSNVLNNEPHTALFVSNTNPLVFYDKIADLATKHLSKNGMLFFEINQYLGKETVALLKNKNFTTIELRKDIFGNDRMIKATFKTIRKNI